jgi:rRNA-processing protein FCF1
LKVLLDANALMVPEQFGVDIFGELMRLGYVDCIVPESVIEELVRLKDKADKGLDKVAASVGLSLAQRCKVISSTGYADLALENLAVKENAAVFTNDKELKKRLIRRGITVIYLRQGRYLEATKKEF